jgi:hypothetical protein
MLVAQSNLKLAVDFESLNRLMLANVPVRLLSNFLY